MVWYFQGLTSNICDCICINLLLTKPVFQVQMSRGFLIMQRSKHNNFRICNHDNDHECLQSFCVILLHPCNSPVAILVNKYLFRALFEQLNLKPFVIKNKYHKT